MPLVVVCETTSISKLQNGASGARVHLVEKFQNRALAAATWNHDAIDICIKEYFLGFSFSHLHDFAFVVVSLQKMIPLL